MNQYSTPIPPTVPLEEQLAAQAEHNTKVLNGKGRVLARDTDGAALYLQAMWEEAQETGQPVDWRAADEVLEAAQQDAIYVDECQSGFSDWRWA